MGLDQSCPNLRERGAICRLIKFAELSFSFFIAIQYLNPVSAKISVIPADPHLATVSAHRGEIITAALTLVLSYGKAGAPTIDGLHALGGFEIWDRMVRRPLVWLGMPDPLAASEGLRDQDPDIEAMRLLFSSWLAVFGNMPTTVADVVAAGNETSPMTQTYVNTELRDALQLVCAEKLNSRRLGYWLRAHRERIVDGLQLRQSGADGHAKVAKWRVIKCG